MPIVRCVSDAATCSVGGSEALLEGRLDILQQAPLRSVLPVPVGGLHLQAEAESHGVRHRETVRRSYAHHFINNSRQSHEADATDSIL